MRPKIAILGNSASIGKYLVNSLNNIGAEIIIIDDRPRSSQHFKALGSVAEKVHYIYDSLDRIETIPVVYECNAIINTIDLLHRAAENKKFIYKYPLLVDGCVRVASQSDAKYIHLSPFVSGPAETKCITHSIVETSVKRIKHNLAPERCIVLHYTVPFGPTSGLVHYIRKASKLFPFLLPLPHSKISDHHFYPIYAGTLTHNIVQLLKRDAQGDFFISGGRGQTLHEIAHTTLESLKQKRKIYEISHTKEVLFKTALKAISAISIESLYHDYLDCKKYCLPHGKAEQGKANHLHHHELHISDILKVHEDAELAT